MKEAGLSFPILLKASLLHTTEAYFTLLSDHLTVLDSELVIVTVSWKRLLEFLKPRGSVWTKLRLGIHISWGRIKHYMGFSLLIFHSNYTVSISLKWLEYKYQINFQLKLGLNFSKVLCREILNVLYSHYSILFLDADNLAVLSDGLLQSHIVDYISVL